MKPLFDPRSWMLMAGALVCISRFFAYAFPVRPEPLPFGLDALSQVLPLWAFGCFWGFAAILCGYLAVSRKRVLWAISFSTGMPTLWGLAYLGGWFWSIAEGDVQPGILTAIIYLCLTIFILGAGITPPWQVMRHGADRAGRPDSN